MRPITERMGDAKTKMIEQRRRTPRVFFLSREDYSEFCATGPDYDWVPFHQGGKPAEQFCPLFDKIAVRQSASEQPKYQNRLFCCVGTSIQVPVA